MTEAIARIGDKLIHGLRRAWIIAVHLWRIAMILFVAGIAVVQKVGRILWRRLKIWTKMLFRRIGAWYWNLPAKTRHRVGWTSVIVALCLTGLLLWGICRGVCAAGVWVHDTYAQWTTRDEALSSATEPAVINLDAYSGNNRHRSYKCGELNRKRRVNLHRDFKDLNDRQLIAARRLGISPIATRNDLEKKKSKLVLLKDTRYYCVDPMLHSMPYLVPDASDFLTALGARWQEYHGTDSRFIVTSCLRTEKDVKRLRRGNVNATKDSCHRYGTTFDITYVRFDRHGRVRDGKLKEDLARALLDMKEAGYCYVKYEYRQSCFHVTVRPR